MSALTGLPREAVLGWLCLASGLGACLGSFANVLIHRLPRGESVSGPRSRCPHCGHRVRWHDNIPIVSWLMLRARCRDCGAPISARYVCVELAGAALGALVLLRFGPSIAAVAALLFLVDLLAVAVIDWQFMIIPHSLTIAGMVLGLALSVWCPVGPGGALVGLLAGAGLILALGYGYKAVRGELGMGGGDVMLMGMVGSFTGVRGVLLVLLGGALLGTAYAAVRYRASLAGKTRLPFGTFLALAAAGACLAGEAAFRWYLDLLH